MLLASLDDSLVRDATVVVQRLDVASGLQRQLLEPLVHIMDVLGLPAVLLFPDVLHDEFDYNCIEDGTRERMSKFPPVEGGVDRSRVGNGIFRHPGPAFGRWRGLMMAASGPPVADRG